jgi:hypothetical protein
MNRMMFERGADYPGFDRTVESDNRPVESLAKRDSRASGPRDHRSCRQQLGTRRRRIMWYRSLRVIQIHGRDAPVTSVVLMERSLDDRGLAEKAEAHSVTRPSRAKRSVAWLQALAFLLGAVLLVYLIRRVGVEQIFSALSRVGFGFFFVVAANGARHVLRTIAMRLSVPQEHRRFSFLQAFAARLGGESMSFLTFAGPLLGEATKVALLRKRSLVHGVPALVVDNLLYNLSVVLVIFGGAVWMLFAYPVPR